MVGLILLKDGRKPNVRPWSTKRYGRHLELEVRRIKPRSHSSRAKDMASLSSGVCVLCQRVYVARMIRRVSVTERSILTWRSDKQHSVYWSQSWYSCSFLYHIYLLFICKLAVCSSVNAFAFSFRCNIFSLRFWLRNRPYSNFSWTSKS